MRVLNSSVALTGGGGFLGFHTRALLHSLGRHTTPVSVGNAFDTAAALDAINGADRLIHIAGVNRGTEREVQQDNVRFARQLASVLALCSSPPPVVVFANSTQAGNETGYGQGKQEAAEVLAAAAAAVGSSFVNVPLPNLFGEHGRPFYNSVTATFCHMLATGGRPEVRDDKPLTLLHAQDAAELLTGSHPASAGDARAVTVRVSALLEQLSGMAAVYRDGSLPPLQSPFDRDLFNTYRSHMQPEDRVCKLDRRADSRGAFFEVVRSPQSSSQASFSTTVPGVTRGQHFHLRKIERFSVLSGTGRISMRRLFSKETLSFEVTGDEPVSIDMPTMWAHNVSNTSNSLLYTMFWSNEIFDSQAPDTFPEDV
jgi:UDP-2-acetamido-2,6-beta-L-arabino-hexul-4-ose reductase